jgi:DNA-binding winged helix-turn-helix (wHTH) protein/TolB-like protein
MGNDFQQPRQVLSTRLRYRLVVMKYRFADFEFDPSTGELMRQGCVIPLQPQPARVLTALIQRPGQVLSRSELQGEVWDETTHVDSEQGLNWCIRRLREALDDTATNSRFIQTLPKRGYRFVAHVRECKTETSGGVRRVWSDLWRMAGFALGAVGIIAGIWLASRRANDPKRAVTVLILPFDNVSASQSGSEFQLIASDQLMAKLALIDPKRLSVIDPLTARKFKDTKECIIEIGNTLGADYVVTGEVDPSMDTVKVHAQMFQVSTNRQIWASEGELPRRIGYSTVWDSMSRGIATQLRDVAHLSN